MDSMDSEHREGIEIYVDAANYIKINELKQIKLQNKKLILL